GQFDAATYDIVQYYAWAMKEAKVTCDPKRLADERSAIRDALKRMKQYAALEGSISFGEDNDALKPVYVQEVRDGRWVLLDGCDVLVDEPLLDADQPAGAVEARDVVRVAVRLPRVVHPGLVAVHALVGRGTHHRFHLRGGCALRDAAPVEARAGRERQQRN